MSRLRYLVFVVLAALLASCSQAATSPAPVQQAVVPTIVPTTQSTTAVANAAGQTTSAAYEKALSCVASQLPAAKYMTNEYLPIGPVDGPTPGGPGKLRKVKVGLSWVLNDEHAMFYNAVALGYFNDEGLDVELVAGGPGKDHIQTLGGGVVDIAVAPAGSAIPLAVASKTPIQVRAVGTILKGGPGILLTADKDLLGREVTPNDLKNRTVAIQPGGEVYIDMLLDKNGVARDSVKIIEAGFQPDVLLTDPPRADFFVAWVMNQPRFMDQAGVKWNALALRKWSYNEYSQTIAVRQDTLNTPDGQDVVRRFLRATARGTQYLLDHPAESAKIAVKYAAEVKLTEDQAVWRFEHQKDLIVGDSQTPLLQMDPKKWDEMMAMYLQYDQLQLSCK